MERGRVLACDNDPEAVAVARENFERAGVQVELSGESIAECPGGLADLITANISPAWILDLAVSGFRVLRPGGLAILSGFEAADIPRVTSALELAGGAIAGVFGEKEWRMIEMREMHRQ